MSTSAIKRRVGVLRRRSWSLAAGRAGQGGPARAKDLRRLTERDLDQFYARLAVVGGRSGKGMHSTTRHHFHALIRAALNQAIRWRWLSPPNPAGEAQAPGLGA